MTNMLEVPDPILSAAVALLKPYVPDLTVKGLTNALTTSKPAATGHTAMEKPMTRKEAADFLQVSLETIKRLVKAGKIRAAKIGHSVRIDPKSVRALLSYGGRERQG